MGGSPDIAATTWLRATDRGASATPDAGPVVGELAHATTIKLKTTICANPSRRDARRQQRPLSLWERARVRPCPVRRNLFTILVLQLPLVQIPRRLGLRYCNTHAANRGGDGNDRRIEIERDA